MNITSDSVYSPGRTLIFSQSRDNELLNIRSIFLVGLRVLSPLLRDDCGITSHLGAVVGSLEVLPCMTRPAFVQLTQIIVHLQTFMTTKYL